MQISLADSSLKPQIKQLWHDCFGDTDPYLSWYFDNIYKDKNTVAAAENGNLLGAAQLRDHKIVMHGKTHQCAYVCGVCTHPESRGKKIGSLIMSEIANVSRQRGNEFNVLVPIIDGFYEKNGFVRCFDRTEYFFDIADIVHFKSKDQYKVAAKEDAKLLVDNYMRFASGYDCYMLRTEEYFCQLIDQYNACGGGCVLFENGGYIMFYPEKGTLRIEEAVALNLQAAEDILAFVAEYKNCEKAILRCGENDLFSLILNTLYVKCVRTHNINIQPFEESETDILLNCGRLNAHFAQLMGLNGGYRNTSAFVNILL